MSKLGKAMIKDSKIEMGDYESEPSGFVSNVRGKRVVWIFNERYTKKNGMYYNSKGEALHYTDFKR
ncbi:MAG TPA: hypothetical protein VMZ91_01540 [Candidatus Paceibacterota bacterium]|nr:hypothetical protein [Candidatus Paceibacterota bacterium]